MKTILFLCIFLHCFIASALERPTGTPASLDYVMEFPRDHGSHPDAAYEWWYVTGHLYDLKAAAFLFSVF